MLERTKGRRQALHILYQREITGEPVEHILNERSFSPEEGEPNEYSRKLLAGIDANRDEIDEAIGRISEHWALARMPLVDRNILRIAGYEILCLPGDVPASVAINEAVELAKTFGGEDSSKFVNGVLGRLAEQTAEEEGATDG